MADVPLETLCELMRHMEWADAHVWRAIRAHPAAGQDERICALLHHYHGVQRAFLTLWSVQPFAPPAADTPELWATEAAVRDYYRELHAAMAVFDDAALRRPIVMPGLEPFEKQMGRTFDRPALAETILQVASHSTHHRGQVIARLRELGTTPPLVDYIAWIWFGRPAAEWP